LPVLASRGVGLGVSNIVDEAVGLHYIETASLSFIFCHRYGRKAPKQAKGWVRPLQHAYRGLNSSMMLFPLFGSHLVCSPRILAFFRPTWCELRVDWARWWVCTTAKVGLAQFLLLALGSWLPPRRATSSTHRLLLPIHRREENTEALYLWTAHRNFSPLQNSLPCANCNC
jgi:hypothetical protein